MWMSGDEALQLVQAMTADLDRARAEVDRLEVLRAQLLRQLQGQELSMEQLAEACGVSRAGVYRLVHGVEPMPVLDRMPTPSEVRRMLVRTKPAHRITETRRVRVA